MRLAGIFLLHAQRSGHQIIQHLGLGASDKRRHVQMHHKRIGLAIAKNNIENFFGDQAIILLQSADRAIHRIGDAGAGRQFQRSQWFDRSGIERRHVKSQPRKVVGCQHAGTATVAEQRDFFCRLRRFGRQRLKGQQRVNKLIERIHQHAARLTCQCHPHTVVARERAGVRGRRSQTLLRAATFEYHHRLGRFARAQQFKQATAIFGGFNVHANHFGLCISKIIFDQLRRHHVSAVAHGNQP